MVLLCLALLASLTVAASADATQRFFIEECSSHTCIGNGSISDRTATAVFTATPLPNAPVLPGEAYHSEIWVMAYDNGGYFLGVEIEAQGTTQAVATYQAEKSIGHTFNTFEFMGVNLGKYLLFNS